jgi:hypothetical protein
LAAGSFDLNSISAIEVPMARFEELDKEDVLFVDTTHTVKMGSEVNRVVLAALPVLAAGAVVHFHDIFLPWAYPRVWLKKSRWFWAEQYVLQAFLAFNCASEPLLAAHALSQPPYAERLRAVVQTFDSNVRPGAFWLRYAPQS